MPYRAQQHLGEARMASRMSAIQAQRASQALGGNALSDSRKSSALKLPPCGPCTPNAVHKAATSGLEAKVACGLVLLDPAISHASH